MCAYSEVPLPTLSGSKILESGGTKDKSHRVMDVQKWKLVGKEWESLEQFQYSSRLWKSNEFLHHRFFYIL